jgi:formate dehydrogenase subunit delta
MNIEHLVQMANQISQFFESQPDHAEAVTGVADHLQRFWDPRMRKEIIAHAEAGGRELRPLALEAVTRLAAEATSRAA